MLKVGVLGAGHLGKIHLRLLKQSDKTDSIKTLLKNFEGRTLFAVSSFFEILPFYQKPKA